MISLAQYFPRKIALQHDEAIASSVLSLEEGISTLLRPITLVLMAIANLFLRLFKQQINVEDEAFSEEDVMSMLEVGQDVYKRQRVLRSGRIVRIFYE